MNPYSHFSIPAFDDFLLWLAGTPLRHVFYPYQGMDGFVTFVHVLAASVLFGSILLVDLKLLGRGRRLLLLDLARYALPWAVAGGVGALLSGFVLLMFDPITVGSHTYFLPKMALIVLGLVNAALFHSMVRLADTPTRPRAAGLLAMTSIVLWTGVFLFASLNGAERISSAHDRADTGVGSSEIGGFAL